jgi:hypothetical protein
MTTGPAPGHDVGCQRWVRAGDGDPPARSYLGEHVLEQQMGAFPESDVTEVDRVDDGAHGS